ncbi:MAG: sulfite exporter TauE/SafE family protein [bacterium]|nr:sulfite exporter TauE/SafE family protein [bacterium]
MSELITFISVFLIGIIASIFGTMVGGGTLLSIPFLMLVGFPPQVAIATERFGGIGQTIAAFIKFLKSEKIVWKYVLGLTVISVAGSLVGSNILINTNPAVLHNMVGVIILVLLPLLFLKKDLGIQHTTVSRNKIIIGSIIYFFVQIFAAFFGGGTGILIAYTLMFCFGLTIIEATATKIVPWFFLSISSLVIFANKGIINYKMGVVMLAGMAIGGYMGAHIVLKRGNVWLKRLFLFFVIISVIKLLFF